MDSLGPHYAEKFLGSQSGLHFSTSYTAKIQGANVVWNSAQIPKIQGFHKFDKVLGYGDRFYKWFSKLCELCSYVTD
jgi:hypothetical protein